VGWARRYQRVVPPAGVVKVNLGCGLEVADGWINIDNSLNSFFAGWSPPFLGVLYQFAGQRRWHSSEEYVSILKRHTFVNHNLAYGIPLPDESTDYVYSSHFLEHLPRDTGQRLIREAHRILKPGGTVRICVPDLELAIAEYLRGSKERALDYFYEWSVPGQFNRHQFMFDFDLLSSLLSSVGFTSIERSAYRQGRTPDLSVLDNRPDETLYVEARK
jgi:predicted SAM-dependent methyltransferase